MTRRRGGPSTSGARPSDLVRAVALALTVLAAPTVGDIGSCGQPVVQLDAAKFFAEKRLLDCRACSRCGFDTDRCAEACGGALPASEFPVGCFPLVHDGEVCLDALAAASCGDYRSYIDDEQPTVPTECNFCPIEAPSDVVAEDSTAPAGGEP